MAIFNSYVCSPNTMLDMTDNTGLILLVVASLVGKNNPRLRKKTWVADRYMMKTLWEKEGFFV
jgi:aminoglycoside phosphotransferase